MKKIRDCYKVSRMVDRKIAQLQYRAMHLDSKSSDEERECLSKKMFHKTTIR